MADDISFKVVDANKIAEWCEMTRKFQEAQRNPKSNSEPIPTYVSQDRVFHGYGTKVR